MIFNISHIIFLFINTSTIIIISINHHYFSWICNFIFCGIFRYFEDQEVRERCVEAIRLEKERLSWKRFANDLVSLSQSL